MCSSDLKPQLGDIPPKPSVSEKRTPPDMAGTKPVADGQLSGLQGEQSPKQASEETNGSPPGAMEMPVPLPRKINTVRRQTNQKISQFYN